MSEKGKRIAFVDIAKAIGLLLVIVGHTTSNPYVFAIIYSFHMPLFFVMSGITSKYSKNILEYRNSIKKYFIKLVPLGCLLHSIVYIVQNINMIKNGWGGDIFI